MNTTSLSRRDAALVNQATPVPSRASAGGEEAAMRRASLARVWVRTRNLGASGDALEKPLSVNVALVAIGHLS